MRLCDGRHHAVSSEGTGRLRASDRCGWSHNEEPTSSAVPTPEKIPFMFLFADERPVDVIGAFVDGVLAAFSTTSER